MNRHLWSYAAVLALLLANRVHAADWIAAPSHFTHDETGQRVAQYLPPKPVFYVFDPTFVRSGYHHTRSSLRFGQSADHFHVVEEWGRPVRPYGEWRYPYRPYSVPYDLWGPPFGGLSVMPWPYSVVPGGPFDAPPVPGTGP